MVAVIMSFFVIFLNYMEYCLEIKKKKNKKYLPNATTRSNFLSETILFLMIGGILLVEMM